MAELDYDALREAAETALEAGRQHSFIVPTSLYRFHDAFTPSVGVALLDRVRELEAELAKARNYRSLPYNCVWQDYYSPDEVIKLRAEADDERDAALSTIAKVEGLHQPFEWSFGFGPVTSCKGCADQGVPQENASWPCPTVRALGSVPSTGEGNE